MTKKYILVIFLFALAPAARARQTTASTVSGFVYDKSSESCSMLLWVRTPLTSAILGYEPSQNVIKVSGKQSRLLKIYLTQSGCSEQEVVVTGDSASFAQKAFDRPVSSLDLTSQEINAIPKVGEADLLRAPQSLSGITSVSDFSSAINVRGGTPDQNLYLIDVAEIYDPNHALGIFSTFNTDAIKKVEVFKGGFGPQFDDRLSSVIDVIDDDGNRNHFRGIFDLSLIAANLTLQVPLGSLGSISGSFRRTYIDLTAARIDKSIPPYYFYDGNFKAFLQLSGKDNLTLSFFKTYDNLSVQQAQSSLDFPPLLIDWGNTLGSANWKHLFSDRLFLSLYLTYSAFSSAVNVNQDAQIGYSAVKNPLADYTAREAFTYYASDRMTFEVGGEYKYVSLSYNEDDGGLGLIDLSNKTGHGGTIVRLPSELSPAISDEPLLKVLDKATDSNYLLYIIVYKLVRDIAYRCGCGVCRIVSDDSVDGLTDPANWEDAQLP